MNTPGIPGGNWQWRVSASALNASLAADIRELSALYGRLPDPVPEEDNADKGETAE